MVLGAVAVGGGGGYQFVVDVPGERGGLQSRAPRDLPGEEVAVGVVGGTKAVDAGVLVDAVD